MKLSVHIISSLFSALLAFAATSASGQTGTLTDSPALAASGENGTGPQAQTVSTPQTQAAVPESKTLVKVGDPVPDFTVKMFDGSTVDIASLKGKVVLINFWATWCPPCQQEMPDIQSMYASYGENQGDLVVLGVANPKTDQYPHNQDVTAEEIKSFLEKGQYTYPTAMDTTGQVFANYGISSYPTTFMIDRQGNIFGYVPGMLSRSMMESIVKQTMEGKRAE